MSGLIVFGNSSSKHSVNELSVKVLEHEALSSVSVNAQLRTSTALLFAANKQSHKVFANSNIMEYDDYYARLVSYLLQLNAHDLPNDQLLLKVTVDNYRDFSTVQISDFKIKADLIDSMIAAKSSAATHTCEFPNAAIDGLIIFVNPFIGSPRIQCFISLTGCQEESVPLYGRLRKSIMKVIDAKVDFFRLSFEDMKAISGTSYIYGMSIWDSNNMRLSPVRIITCSDQSVGCDAADFIQNLYPALVKELFN